MDRKTETVTLWCSPDEVREFDSLASDYGYNTRTAFIRDAVYRGIAEIVRSEPVWLSDRRAIEKLGHPDNWFSWIEWIKDYRALTGSTLKQAKQRCDKLRLVEPGKHGMEGNEQ